MFPLGVFLASGEAVLSLKVSSDYLFISLYMELMEYCSPQVISECPKRGKSTSFNQLHGSDSMDSGFTRMPCLFM